MSIPQKSDYENCLDTVESFLKVITSKPIEEVMSGLTDFEKSKLKTALAYAITTLQLCYLKTKGEQIEDHHNMKYLTSLKQFFSKMDRYMDLSSK